MEKQPKFLTRFNKVLLAAILLLPHVLNIIAKSYNISYQANAYLVTDPFLLLLLLFSIKGLLYAHKYKKKYMIILLIISILLGLLTIMCLSVTWEDIFIY